MHIDYGLVVPMLSVRGMRCALSDLLDLAPVNKVSIFRIFVFILETTRRVEVVPYY